jgi:hypothetical protein
MKKERTLSINEINLITTMILLFGLVIFVSGFVTIAFVIYVTAIIFISKKELYRFKSKKLNLPGKSVLKSKNEMEIHIGASAKGELDNFFSIACKSIIYSYQNSLTCTFYSWHFSNKFLRKHLGDNVEISEVEGFERFAQLFGNRFYYNDKKEKKKSNRKINPLMKVVVNKGSFNQKTLDSIKSKIND